MLVEATEHHRAWEAATWADGVWSPAYEVGRVLMRLTSLGPSHAA